LLKINRCQRQREYQEASAPPAAFATIGSNPKKFHDRKTLMCNPAHISIGVADVGRLVRGMLDK
jgi:hypothetical protein